MRIAVLELSPGGHRYTYVRRLLPALAEVGEVVFVTSAQGRDSEQYRAQIAPLEGTFQLDAHADLGDASEVVGASFAALRRAARELNVDHVIMPYCDGTIQRAGLARLTGRLSLPPRVELEGLMMRGRYAHEPPAGLAGRMRGAAWVALVRAAPFPVIHHLDRVAIDWMTRQSPALGARLRLLPDPAEHVLPVEVAEARCRLGVPEAGRVIGCVGVLDERKGIDLLVRAFLAAELPADSRLLLAGAHAPEIRRLLAGEGAAAVRASRIVSIDRYLSEEELHLAVAGMDVVAAPYPPGRGHAGSSSVLILAAAHGKPVLSSDAGLQGDTTARFGLGEVCDVLNPAAFAACVRRSLEGAPGFSHQEAARRFVEFNTIENFLACFTARVRERAGLGPLPGRREWSWVVEAANA